MRFLLGISLSWVRNPYRILGALPSPLWGGVGGGGPSADHRTTPTPALRADPPHKGEGKDRVRRLHQYQFARSALLTEFARLRAGSRSARCAAEKRARAWDLPRSGAVLRGCAGAPQNPFLPAGACCGWSAPACGLARRGGAGARNGRAPLRPLPDAKSW